MMVADADLLIFLHLTPTFQFLVDSLRFGSFSLLTLSMLVPLVLLLLLFWLSFWLRPLPLSLSWPTLLFVGASPRLYTHLSVSPSLCFSLSSPPPPLSPSLSLSLSLRRP